MSTSPRFARAAAQLLTERLETPWPSDAVRKRTIGALRGALVERKRVRRRRTVFVRIAAAAALVLGVSGAVPRAHRPVVIAKAPAPATPASTAAIRVEEAHGAVFVIRDERKTALTNHATIALGEHVVSADGATTLALATGTRLELDSNGELVVGEAFGLQLVDLSSGVLTTKVARVGEGRRFVVRTPEAEVEVRGTMFRVARERDERCEFVTRVHVTEGRVAVRSPRGESALDAGGEWTSACKDASSKSSVAPAASRSGYVAPPAPAASAPRNVAPPASTPPEIDLSDLAAQNALFRGAMEAKTRGDARGAVADLDTLMTRYPTTPLREAALLQRMKLLATFDRSAAAIAARAYLETYPNGFGRSDAELLASKESR